MVKAPGNLLDAWFNSLARCMCVWYGAFESDGLVDCILVLRRMHTSYKELLSEVALSRIELRRVNDSIDEKDLMLEHLRRAVRRLEAEKNAMQQVMRT